MTRLGVLAVALTASLQFIVGPAGDWILGFASGTDDPGPISMTTCTIIILGLMALAYLAAGALAAHWSGVSGARLATVTVAAFIVSAALLGGFTAVVARMPGPVWQALGSDDWWLLVQFGYSTLHICVAALLSRLPVFSGTHLTSASSGSAPLA